MPWEGFSLHSQLLFQLHLNYIGIRMEMIFIMRLWVNMSKMAHIIVGPNPESNGGDVEGVGDEVAHVPHVTHVPSG